MKNKRIFIMAGAAILICIIILVAVFTSNRSVSVRVSKQLDLGQKYLLEGNYQEAILAFEKAIQIDPKNIEARIALADIYIETNELDKAEIRLKEALEIKEDETETVVKLAKVKHLQGDEDEVLQLLDGIIQNTADTDVYLLYAEILIGRGDIEQAATLLKEALSKNNDPRIKALLDEIVPDPSAASIGSKEYTETVEVELIDSAQTEQTDTSKVTKAAEEELNETPVDEPAPPTPTPVLIDAYNTEPVPAMPQLGEDIDPEKYNKIIVEPGKSIEFKADKEDIYVTINGIYDYEIYKTDDSSSWYEKNINRDSFYLGKNYQAIITNTGNGPMLVYGSKKEFFPQISTTTALTEITV